LTLYRIEEHNISMENKDVKIKSLAKCMKVLEAFTATNPERGITEIANELGLTKSNVYNLISSLAEIGYVEKNPKTEKYRLSFKVLEFSYVVTSGLKFQSAVMSNLQHLSDELNLLAYFGVPYGTHVLYVYNTSSRNTANSYYVRSVLGEKAPLFCTSIGKAILSTMEEEEILARIDMDRQSFTPNTVTDPDTILGEIRETKRRGYAIDDMEHENNIKCVGIPIFDKAGKLLGGMSISGMASRFTDDKIEEYAHRLSEAAYNVKNRL